MLRNGLGQYGQSDLRDEPLFLLPLLVIKQVIVEAPEAQTLTAEDIPRFETVPEESIDQKLIAVGTQAFVALGISRIQVAFEGLPNTADRELLHRVLAERFASLPSRREKVDRVQHRMAGGGRGELDRQEHRAQMPLELRGQGIDMIPVKGRFVNVRRAGEMVGNAGELGAREHPKGVPPQLLEWGRVGDLVGGKQLQHASGVLQRLVTR